jgi:Tfp pilus assembly protein PilO
MKQRQEHSVLTSRIADARQTLAQLPVPAQNLEERLAAAEVRLSDAQRSFPTRLNSTQVINDILKLANRHNITAIPLVTKPWSTEKVRQHDYQVFRLNLALAGSYSQLVTFVSELEEGDYETLIVEDLSVTRANEQSEKGTIGITASLELAIYTQSPMSD